MNGDIPWVELVFALLGGAALLMYGIQLTSEGLEEASGPRMRRLLGIMTKNVYLGFLVGTIVVALVGSSTAVSVMTVGFVNAGVIDLRQACGIIYGANVGTTSDAIAIALVMSVEKLNLRIVALGMMAAGFVMMFFTKRRKFKSPGKAIFGFGLVFLALTLLSSGATTLKESETAAQALAALGENPLLGVFVGVVATFLVHSSSTTVAMNLALAQAGLLNIEASLALILGDNIGTCLTAQIAALGTSIPARRTAWAHTLHNVIGVMLALAFFPLLVKFALWISPEIVRQIAFTHGLFNVASAMLFLPLTGPFVALLTRMVPGEVVTVEAGPKFIDKLLLDHPEVAITQVRREIVRMAEMAQGMLADAMETLRSNDTRRMDSVVHHESAIDALEEECVQYMVELSQVPLDLGQSNTVAGLLHAVSDVERISDHALNIAQIGEEKANEGIPFTADAMEGLEQIYEKVYENVGAAARMLGAEEGDQFEEMADDIWDREDEVDGIEVRLRRRHVERLREGGCEPNAGVLYVTLLSNFERISDHCTNIAEDVQGPMQRVEERRDAPG